MYHRRLWVALLLLLLVMVSACGPGKDKTEEVAEQFMQAVVANDLAVLQEVVDPACQEDVLTGIFLQMGLAGAVGGAQAEYVELEVQTTDKDKQYATVHASGKIKVQTLGTQMIAPVDLDIPLVKKDGQWYIACDYVPPSLGQTSSSEQPTMTPEPTNTAEPTPLAEIRPLSVEKIETGEAGWSQLAIQFEVCNISTQWWQYQAPMDWSITTQEGYTYDCSASTLFLGRSAVIPPGMCTSGSPFNASHTVECQVATQSGGYTLKGTVAAVSEQERIPFPINIPLSPGSNVAPSPGVPDTRWAQVVKPGESIETEAVTLVFEPLEFQESWQGGMGQRAIVAKVHLANKSGGYATLVVGFPGLVDATGRIEMPFSGLLSSEIGPGVQAVEEVGWVVEEGDAVNLAMYPYLLLTGFYTQTGQDRDSQSNFVIDLR